MKRRSGHLFKRGRVWYVRIVANGQVIVRSTGTRIEKEARQRMKEIIHPFVLADEARVLENVTDRMRRAKREAWDADPTLSPALTLNAAWDAFLESSKRPDSGPETLRQYSVQWGRFVKWIEKKHPTVCRMRDVAPTHAEAFIQELKKVRSANTVNKYLASLSLVFRVLRIPGRIEKTPFEDIPRLRSIQQGRRELTVEELRKVCANATGELRTLFAIGLYSGLRLGDAVTLRWSETDLERQLLRRIPNKTARGNPKPVSIPIHPSLLFVLQEVESSTPDPRPEFIMPTLAHEYLANRACVTNQIQQHFHACGIRTTKEGTGFKIVKDAEGKEKRVKTGNRAVVEVGYHSLRHSFVSMCRERGVPLAVVEEIVGHSNPAMTRHYTHTGEEAALLAVQSLPRIIENPALALPTPETQTPEQRLQEVLELARQMTAETWSDLRDKQLAVGEEVHVSASTKP